jgi:hypothetical protein
VPTLAIAVEEVVPELAPVAAPEIAALPIAPVPIEPPPVAAPPKIVEAPKVATRKPTRKVAPVATGPEVTVHFRLEGGLAEADVKLGKRVIPVRPRYDGRVPSGKYDAKFRVATGDKWRDAGAIAIGASGEWKLLVGPKGARVSKL